MVTYYILDTNCVIDYLNNKLSLTRESLIEQKPITISIISRMELLGWPNITPKQTDILTGFITSCTIITLNEPIVLKVIELRKQYRIKLPDAIIAATAIINNATLMTNNISDFKDLKELNVLALI